MENITIDTDVILEMLVNYGMNVVGAVATVIIGLYLVKYVARFLISLMVRANVDPSLKTFLGSLVSIVLKVLVYVTAISVLGVEMTSFVALLGAAGLAVGLALSGTLQNFAGGVMILMFKPFKLGDVIEAQSYLGTVQEIQIFITVLTTFDNKTILIPNGPLANGSLINYTAQATRRVDWTFSIAYGDDLEAAYGVIDGLVAADDRILSDPEPFRAVIALADSSVNIVVRVWVESEQYWPVFFQMNEEIYKAFPQAGLTIPFPQRDVHIYNEAPMPSVPRPGGSTSDTP